MAKRLLNKDATRGTEVWMHDNPEGGWTIEQKQHVSQMLEQNKRLRDEWQQGKLIGNTQKHWQQVADIPAALYLQLKEKYGEPNQNPKEWRKWLNDYDNRFFRTSGGHI